MSDIVGYFDSTTEGIRAGNDQRGLARVWLDVTACPYCQGAFGESELKGLIDRAVIDNAGDLWNHACERRAATIKECLNPQCGWWTVFSGFIEMSSTYGEYWVRRGEVKVFAEQSPEAQLELLHRELCSNPNLVFSTHHQKFEILMSDAIRDKFPGSTVHHVGKTGDGGIDAFAIINDEPVIVQVKRRTDPNRVEGPKVVRELNGVLLREGVYRGIVITTAQRFSRAAFDETTIKMPTPKPVTIDLISYEGVAELLNTRRSRFDRAWMRHLVTY
jgi:hypothetical protein